MSDNIVTANSFGRDNCDGKIGYRDSPIFHINIFGKQPIISIWSQSKKKEKVPHRLRKNMQVKFHILYIIVINNQTLNNETKHVICCNLQKQNYSLLTVTEARREKKH